MWQAGEEVIQITSSGCYLNNLFGRLCGRQGRRCEGKPTRMRRLCLKTYETAGRGGLGITSSSEDRANKIGQSWCPADLFDFQLPSTGTSQRPPIDPMQTHVA